MITAYKYLKLKDGILLVFEKEMLFDGTDVVINFERIGNSNYLKIREEHFVSLNEEIFEWLKKTKKLYIAVSEVFDSKIEIQEAIVIDDISVGKLLAYMDISRSCV